MFQTFTGNSRRPRQVNLSGRNQNPFAKHGSPQGSSNTVAVAQQNRLERQQERARVQAVTNLQRTWRGYKARKQLRLAQRKEWDDDEQRGLHTSEDAPAYVSDECAYQQIVRLLYFMDVRDSTDQKRLERAYKRLVGRIRGNHNACVGGPWPMVYLRLQNTCLNGLQRAERDRDIWVFWEQVLAFTTEAIPDLTAKNAQRYYLTLRDALSLTATIPSTLIVAPLKHLGSFTELAYQSLAVYILTTPKLAQKLEQTKATGLPLEQLAENLNCKLLTSAMSSLIQVEGNVSAILYRPVARPESRQLDAAELVQSCAWLVAQVVYFHRYALGFGNPERFASDPSFTFVVCALLSVIGNNIPQDGTPLDGDVHNSSLLSRRGFDQFVLDQLDALVNQKAIASLISQMNVRPLQERNISTSPVQRGDQIRALATYILTLLRLYPNRGDDIRMWLYVGSSANVSGDGDFSGQTAVKFFWQASRNTSVFRSIYSDPRTAIALLKPKTSATPSQFNRGSSTHHPASSIEDEWQIILLFVEMYSFVLKVMDDEEFFSYDAGAPENAPRTDTNGRRNSLRLNEIMILSTFLKHLGFTMYYNAADISGTREEESSKDIRSLFKPPSPHDAKAPRFGRQNQSVSASGVNLDYLKGAVTGLLRSIYERDSRRSFMPKDHWLMTERFDMTSFIDAVVEEEERRHQVQEAEADDENDGDSADDHWDVTRLPGLVGTGHAQQLQKLENLRRQQRKESRKRYLQAVAPRLEILQNMPFLIPFTTRVQIFRRFVHLDQLKRRNGTADPEVWRLSQMHSFNENSLERHHARVRRGHEFTDAFDQFYELGAGLKEPIHITFLDRFDQEEAGIDGGGVTKEFLTSVTTQAFSDQEGVRLFTENDKHLLFPNPNALDEQKEVLKEAGFRENTPEFHEQMIDMHRRYEFLGRVIGKCLYEGILVDIGFAGFFLLKWALTGGSGSAPKESGYRANINDLRDFDEELYQGLLKLKNYPGNVEDFALNFTVADTLSIPTARNRVRSKIVTHDLRPGGSDMPVTNTNRLVYISYITRHRLTSQPFPQTTSFLRGLGSMISPSWLSMFNQQELQTLIGGAAAAINVQDLRANTSYGGVYTIGDDSLEHPSVQLFWKVMEDLPDEDRRKVLKFVTSTPRAPLLGFGNLTPKFSIRDSGGDDTRLPSTSTCVNLLKLPRYTKMETCRTKLLQAVNAGAGFDLS